MMDKIIKKIYRATIDSIAGLKAAFRFQLAFRLEVLFLCLGIILAPLLGKSLAQKFILISCLVLIIIIELINSAIETVVNRISLEHHELSGRAKDLGSAAVFVAVLNAIVIWGISMLMWLSS
ncbi:MAG TPA: diacylglycerol kinase [Gammaproteobacteria bacterium]|nr:diacylglycerol kinase [Gammaproteobacteria bacterium]